MQSFSYYLCHPGVVATKLLDNYFKWLPDKSFLMFKFKFEMGYKLNLDNPTTFCEKLQWLKLYDRRPEYTVMVDKVKSKEFVASVIGDEYVIPTLGVWDNPDKIDFDLLPDRFVLKCNHNSGLGMYICTDKNSMDVEKVKDELRKGLKQDYYLWNREWPYKDVPHQILAEQFVDPASNESDLSDYKWYCFNGEPKYCQVIKNRSVGETIDFFDTEWNHQSFVGLNPLAGNAKVWPVKPANLETHLRIAKKLSKGMPFSRIDLYDTGEKVYFGEITLFPASGFGCFRPAQFDLLLGKMLQLPQSLLHK